MRVTLVSANYRPSIGGIERFTEVLADGLAARGHEVAVLCCRKNGAPREERANGVRVVRIPSTYVLHRVLNIPYPVPAPSALPGALRTLVRAADIVHVQDAIYATSAPTLIAARQRVPSVLTQHVGFVPQSNAVLNAVERLAIASIGRCARLASVITTLTPSISEWVTATWGVPAEVLPVGVPLTTHSVDVPAVRDAHGLPRDRFLALFAGRDVAKKGLDHFLSAGDSSYDLVAVTDRPAGSERRARLIPFMSHERLQELLGAVDAFVLPSVGEGFPIVIQEALGHGLPVVTTADDGYRRYVGPGDALFVHPDGASIREALVRLASEPELRDRLSRNARAVAERELSSDRFVEAYEELYERAQAAGAG